MRDTVDELLKRVLTPEEEPGGDLNREIMNQVKEMGCMKHKKYKCASVILAASLVAASSLTAYAAWRYRSAAEVAEKTGDNVLADAFENQSAQSGGAGGELSGLEGESQSFGGYEVTFLGIVSGDSLSEQAYKVNGELRSDRTYIAVAIRREDGSPVDGEHQEFFLSPLVGSLNPGLYNAASFGSGYSQYEEDGVLYRLLGTENIACFADNRLYVCVTDTTFYDSDLYEWDEEGGRIVRNEDYEGLNALFELKLDASLADPEKARKLIEDIDSGVHSMQMGQGNADSAEPSAEDGTDEAMKWAEQITPENIEEYCTRLENTVMTAAPDENGEVSFEWLYNEEVSDTAGGSTKFKVEWYFEDRQPGACIQGYGASEEGMSSLTINTVTLNEDGTVTFAAWVPKEGSIYLK